MHVLGISRSTLKTIQLTTSLVPMLNIPVIASHNREEIVTLRSISLVIEMCCVKSLHMLNGQFNDTGGACTCTANNGCSVVDILASTDVFPSIKHFEIGTFDVSDHFPITCAIEIFAHHYGSHHTFDRDQSPLTPHVTFKWDNRKIEIFREKFKQLYQDFNGKINDETITNSQTGFVSLLQEAGSCMKSCTNVIRPGSRIHTIQPNWWDADCDRAKHIKYVISV